MPLTDPDSAPPAASLRWLLAAPYRLCFSAAMLMLIAAAGASAAVWHFWSAWGGAHLQAAPSLVHALVMAFGFMPLFIVGFLFTAGPRWLRLPRVDARRLAAPVVLKLAGWAVFALFIPVHRGLAAAGLALVSAALAVCVWRFTQMLRTAAARDREADAWPIAPEALLIAGAVACLAALLVFAAIGVAFDDRALADGAVRSALWSGLALAYMAAMHRLVPFFEAGAWSQRSAQRPHLLLGMLAAVVCGQGVLTMADALWVLPRLAQGASAAGDAAAALGVFWLALSWARTQSLQPRLIRMLHLGFVWLGLALAMSAVARSGIASGARWEMAGLHALAIGLFGSLMLAMVTRVSCAHNGRVVVADAFLWRAFWLLQAAAIVRVGAALWPPVWPLSPLLLRVAFVAWVASLLPWALRSLGWYASPDAAPRRATGRSARVVAIHAE